MPIRHPNILSPPFNMGIHEILLAKNNSNKDKTSKNTRILFRSSSSAQSTIDKLNMYFSEKNIDRQDLYKYLQVGLIAESTLSNIEQIKPILTNSSIKSLNYSTSFLNAYLPPKEN